MSNTLETTGESIRPVFDHALGHHVMAVRVDYAPGGRSRPHSHPFGAFVYVIDCSVRMGLEGQPVERLTAGDSWHEPPRAVHAISENASDSEPASLLAVFVLPEGHEPAVAASAHGAES